MDLVEIKTSELIGPALDWAVAEAEGLNLPPCPGRGSKQCLINVSPADWTVFEPSTDWSQGGPLIEKYSVGVYRDYSPAETITANVNGSGCVEIGDTHLVAVCRAIVAAKLGDTVQVPVALIQ
jgi:hypothetical protein